MTKASAATYCIWVAVGPAGNCSLWTEPTTKQVKGGIIGSGEDGAGSQLRIPRSALRMSVAGVWLGLCSSCCGASGGSVTRRERNMVLQLSQVLSCARFALLPLA